MSCEGRRVTSNCGAQRENAPMKVASGRLSNGNFFKVAFPPEIKVEIQLPHSWFFFAGRTQHKPPLPS